MRTMKRYLLSIICMASLACTDPNGASTNDTLQPLLPLRSGNSWHFVQSYFDESGTVTSTKIDSIVLQADTSIGGVTWSWKDEGNANVVGSCRLGYANLDQGASVKIVSSTPAPGPFLRYKYPAVVGDTYRYPEVLYIVPQAYLVDTLYTISVLSTDVVVTVPAGTFHCYKYKIDDIYPNTWEELYISPGNGWIRRDFFSVTTPGTAARLVNSRVTTSIILSR